MKLDSSTLSKTVNFKLPNGMAFSPTYLQLGLMILFIFALILMMGQLRRRFVDWHMQGLLMGVFIGVLATILIEGFLVVGGGALLSKTLGQKNSPAFLTNTINGARTRLIKVLGAQVEEVKVEKSGKKPSVNEVVNIYNQLSAKESSSFRSLICVP